MKFFARIAVLFNVTLVLFVCCFLVFFALNHLELGDVQSFLAGVYHDENLKSVVLIAAGVMVFMNFLLFKIFSVNEHRDKIIAFDNPAGRVSVSLVALEDMIRRRIAKMPEIKDIKAGVTASKKGLSVKVKLVLRSEVNIPEITSAVQEKITRKVHNTIGLEENVDVTVYVGKIIPEKVKGRSQKIQEEKVKPELNVPFEGYRA